VSFEISRRRAQANGGVCHECRYPKPDESQAWVAAIPNERLDELAGALALLR